MVLPPRSGLTVKEEVVNLMASPNMHGAHPRHTPGAPSETSAGKHTPGTAPEEGAGGEQGTLLHAVAYELPLLLAVESLLPALNSPVLGTHNSQVQAQYCMQCTAPYCAMV